MLEKFLVEEIIRDKHIRRDKKDLERGTGGSWCPCIECKRTDNELNAIRPTNTPCPEIGRENEIL